MRAYFNRIFVLVENPNLAITEHSWKTLRDPIHSWRTTRKILPRFSANKGPSFILTASKPQEANKSSVPEITASKRDWPELGQLVHAAEWGKKKSI